MQPLRSSSCILCLKISECGTFLPPGCIFYAIVRRVSHLRLTFQYPPQSKVKRAGCFCFFPLGKPVATTRLFRHRMWTGLSGSPDSGCAFITPPASAFSPATMWLAQTGYLMCVLESDGTFPSTHFYAFNTFNRQAVMNANSTVWAVLHGETSILSFIWCNVPVSLFVCLFVRFVFLFSLHDSANVSVNPSLHRGSCAGICEDLCIRFIFMCDNKLNSWFLTWSVVLAHWFRLKTA